MTFSGKFACELVPYLLWFLLDLHLFSRAVEIGEEMANHPKWAVCKMRKTFSRQSEAHLGSGGFRYHI